MSLLMAISGIEQVKEHVDGYYDDELQMWSSFAGIDDLTDLPIELRTGASSNSAGSEDDTKT